MSGTTFGGGNASPFGGDVFEVQWKMRNLFQQLDVQQQQQASSGKKGTKTVHQMRLCYQMSQLQEHLTKTRTKGGTTPTSASGGTPAGRKNASKSAPRSRAASRDFEKGHTAGGGPRNALQAHMKQEKQAKKAQNKLFKRFEALIEGRIHAASEEQKMNQMRQSLEKELSDCVKKKKTLMRNQRPSSAAPTGSNPSVMMSGERSAEMKHHYHHRSDYAPGMAGSTAQLHDQRDEVRGTNGKNATYPNKMSATNARPLSAGPCLQQAHHTSLADWKANRMLHQDHQHQTGAGALDSKEANPIFKQWQQIQKMKSQVRKQIQSSSRPVSASGVMMSSTAASKNSGASPSPPMAGSSATQHQDHGASTAAAAGTSSATAGNKTDDELILLSPPQNVRPYSAHPKSLQPKPSAELADTGGPDDENNTVRRASAGLDDNASVFLDKAKKRPWTSTGLLHENNSSKIQQPAQVIANIVNNKPKKKRPGAAKKRNTSTGERAMIHSQIAMLQTQLAAASGYNTGGGGGNNSATVSGGATATNKMSRGNSSSGNKTRSQLRKKYGPDCPIGFDNANDGYASDEAFIIDDADDGYASDTSEKIREAHTGQFYSSGNSSSMGIIHRKRGFSAARKRGLSAKNREGGSGSGNVQHVAGSTTVGAAAASSQGSGAAPEGAAARMSTTAAGAAAAANNSSSSSHKASEKEKNTMSSKVAAANARIRSGVDEEHEATVALLQAVASPNRRRRINPLVNRQVPMLDLTRTKSFKEDVSYPVLTTAESSNAGGNDEEEQTDLRDEAAKGFRNSRVVENDLKVQDLSTRREQQQVVLSQNLKASQGGGAPSAASSSSGSSNYSSTTAASTSAAASLTSSGTTGAGASSKAKAGVSATASASSASSGTNSSSSATSSASSTSSVIKRSTKHPLQAKSGDGTTTTSMATTFKRSFTTGVDVLPHPPTGDAVQYHIETTEDGNVHTLMRTTSTESGKVVSGSMVQQQPLGGGAGGAVGAGSTTGSSGGVHLGASTVAGSTATGTASAHHSATSNTAAATPVAGSAAPAMISANSSSAASSSSSSSSSSATIRRSAPNNVANVGQHPMLSRSLTTSATTTTSIVEPKPADLGPGTIPFRGASNAAGEGPVARPRSTSEAHLGGGIGGSLSGALALGQQEQQPPPPTLTTYPRPPIIAKNLLTSLDAQFEEQRRRLVQQEQAAAGAQAAAAATKHQNLESEDGSNTAPAGGSRAKEAVFDRIGEVFVRADSDVVAARTRTDSSSSNQQQRLQALNAQNLAEQIDARVQNFQQRRAFGAGTSSPAGGPPGTTATRSANNAPPVGSVSNKPILEIPMPDDLEDNSSGTRAASRTNVGAAVSASSTRNRASASAGTPSTAAFDQEPTYRQHTSTHLSRVVGKVHVQPSATSFHCQHYGSIGPSSCSSSSEDLHQRRDFIPEGKHPCNEEVAARNALAETSCDKNKLMQREDNISQVVAQKFTGALPPRYNSNIGEANFLVFPPPEPKVDRFLPPKINTTSSSSKSGDTSSDAKRTLGSSGARTVVNNDEMMLNAERIVVSREVPAFTKKQTAPLLRPNNDRTRNYSTNNLNQLSLSTSSLQQQQEQLLELPLKVVNSDMPGTMKEDHESLLSDVEAAPGTRSSSSSTTFDKSGSRSRSGTSINKMSNIKSSSKNVGLGGGDPRAVTTSYDNFVYPFLSPSLWSEEDKENVEVMDRFLKTQEPPNWTTAGRRPPARKESGLVFHDQQQMKMSSSFLSSDSSGGNRAPSLFPAAATTASNKSILLPEVGAAAQKSGASSSSSFQHRTQTAAHSHSTTSTSSSSGNKVGSSSSSLASSSASLFQKPTNPRRSLERESLNLEIEDEFLASLGML